jgi:hypothetical protein
MHFDILYTELHFELKVKAFLFKIKTKLIIGLHTYCPGNSLEDGSMTVVLLTFLELLITVRFTVELAGHVCTVRLLRGHPLGAQAIGLKVGA